MHNEFTKIYEKILLQNTYNLPTSVAKARLKLNRTTKKKKPNVKISHVKRNMIAHIINHLKSMMTLL